MILFILLYTAGWLVHLYAQAKASVQSKSNGLNTVMDWLRLNSHIILVRAVLGVASFLLWIENPNIFGEMVGRSLPMTHATCILAGFCVDSIWDKVTFLAGLRVEVPSLVPPKEGQ